MSRSQREKGKRGERRVANLYREAMPGCDTIKRGWQTRKGTDAPDVDGVPCFAPESKEQKQANVRAALAQAVETAPPGKTAVAHIHDTGREPFVVLRECDWMDLVKEWWHARQA